MAERHGRFARNPLSLRNRERVVGAFFRTTTRWVGLRPELIPAHMRQQLRMIGIGDAELGHVVRNLRSLADWPYAWEAQGDRHAAHAEWSQAASAYYLAQRVLLTDTALKRRLYRMAVDAYERIDHVRPLEHLHVHSPVGETIAGYLQVPDSATPVPLVVIVPGVTACKEEFHVFSEPLLRRGYAVARIDSPGYGETTGRLIYESRNNPATVIKELMHDPRIDSDRMHLFGMSLGAHWVLHSALEAPIRSAVVVAPSIETESFIHDVPASNITAISHMMGTVDFDDVVALGRRLSLVDRIGELTAPIRIFHGARDRTIPLSQSQELAQTVGGPVALTVYDRAHHNCLENFDEMMGATLDWLADPTPAIAAYQREMLATVFDDAAAPSIAASRVPRTA